MEKNKEFEKIQRIIEKELKKNNQLCRSELLRYTLKFSELSALIDIAYISPFLAVGRAFEYGMVKGIRFQKAYTKKDWW